MSFGRNPHVARARTAEQKAVDAPDDASRERAYRDAAHQWDRAAERETSGKQRSEYERNAIENRRLADGGAIEEDHSAHEGGASASIDPKSLN